MTRELDTAVAEVMGWHWDDDWGCLIPPEQKEPPDGMWTGWHYDHDGDDLHREPVPGAAINGVVYNGDMSKIILPEYSADIAAAWAMEGWIDANNLRVRYGEAMLDVLIEDGHLPELREFHTWHLIHATPEQRCRAFLAAMGEEVTDAKHN